MPELLRLLCDADEFSSITIRNPEKKELRELNNSKEMPIKYPLAGYPKALVKTGPDKIYVLAQCFFGPAEAVQGISRSFRQDFDLFMKVSTSVTQHKGSS